MRIYLQTPAEPEKSPRYYQLQLQPDMFGGWGLIREWGTQGGRGTVKRSHYDSRDEAMQALIEWRNKQLQRGFQMVFVTGDGQRVSSNT